MEDSLPIYAFKDNIISAVSNNDVTIITAETGAGKSTQVPQYLLREGYEVIITQPRRLAARSVAERVAQEYDCRLGDEVGYKVAGDSVVSKHTVCTFVTDGLQLVRELLGQKKYSKSNSVLVIDEVHEWNMNIEVLVAWVKHNLASIGCKVVLMSATLESKNLSNFFDGAPIIEVPGRLFPIQEREASPEIIDDIAALVSERRNILVFVPGKSEIDTLIKEIKENNINAEVLPLHGELSREEQHKCFMKYGRSKVVVSTNVAQTSITINDIDAVIDTGIERRVELVNNVEGLYTLPISEADAKQRAGRAGRTKPGIYVDRHHLECSPFDERRAFPVAEIERVRLDQTVLRLAMVGFDMEQLDFFHQPNQSSIHEAKSSLIKLGCLTQTGEVTEIGKQVSKFPVGIQSGRMLVEAIRRGVVDDIVLAVAIFEAGEVNQRKNADGSECTTWLQFIEGERSSDLIAQMKLYANVCALNSEEKRKNGINLKAFDRVTNLCNRIDEVIHKLGHELTSTGNINDITISICAGMVDHVYQNRRGKLINGSERDPNRQSVVLIPNSSLVVGTPFDLQLEGRYGPFTLNLVTMMTRVTVEQLTEAAPHLVEKRVRKAFLWEGEGDVTETLFDGRVVHTEAFASPAH